MRAVLGRRRAAARATRVALAWGSLLAAWCGGAAAQNFDFQPPASPDAATAPSIMRDLAVRVLPVYQENDRERYLERLAALQAVAGNYPSADETRRELRDRRRAADPARPGDGDPGEAEMFDIYVHARAVEAQQKTPFARAFTESFRDDLARIGDREAYAITTWAAPPATRLDSALQQAFDRRRAEPGVSMSDAVQLVGTYFRYEAYRSFRAMLPLLNEEDQRRRFTVEDNVAIRTAGGATLTALLVRPKSATKPMPALLELALDGGAARADAMASAAHGYAGIVAYARGLPKHPGRVVPFQYEGEDARGIIEWAARQPWSDGRVGMYGDGYSGFAAWAAARRPPPALKAIATADPLAPGIDFPMQGNIFRPAAYRWLSDIDAGRVAGPRTDGDLARAAERASVDKAAAEPASPAAGPPATALAVATVCATPPCPFDEDQWHALEATWYRSGAALRELDAMHRQPSWIYHRWLNHPSYDLFWQLMLPFHEQFARVDIPVLTIGGYFADGAVGALYYHSQLVRYNPKADATLVLGPYTDGAVREGPVPVLRGYRVDPVALVDLRELRFQWFDHVLKDAPPPRLLRGRVNYEVMDANRWRHVASIDAMGGDSLRLYIDPSTSGPGRLVVRRPAETGFLRQSVNLADRSDADWRPPAALVGDSPPARNALVFVGDALTQPIEIDGQVAGELDLMPNKMDLDLNLQLYELLPSGVYLPLFDPPFEFRASYARDRVHRRLLRAGERQQLPFVAERITSRVLAAGSRLVVVLGVNKRPDREINFGTGKDVREESVEDGDQPLKIRWYGGTHFDVPVRK